LDACTGCGVCVMVCPTNDPSILVDPDINNERREGSNHV